MEPCTNFLDKVHSKVDVCFTYVENLDSPDTILYTASEKAGEFLENYVPATVALVAKTALHSIHYIAMTVFLPAPLSLAAIGIISAYKISSEPPKNIENLLNGVAFGCLINGVKSLLFLNIIACIVNVVAAAILFSASPLVQALKERFSQKEEVLVEEVLVENSTSPTDSTPPTDDTVAPDTPTDQASLSSQQPEDQS